MCGDYDVASAKTDWRHVPLHAASPQEECTDHDLDGKYAEDALKMFLREIRASRTHPWEYEIKMFGGGTSFLNTLPKCLRFLTGISKPAGSCWKNMNFSSKASIWVALVTAT
jgi:hypothetical protein